MPKERKGRIHLSGSRRQPSSSFPLPCPLPPPRLPLHPPPPPPPLLPIHQNQNTKQTTLFSVGKKVWVPSTQVRSNQDDKVGEKRTSSKPESHWLLPVLTGKSRKHSLKPALWQGPTPLQHPPCNYTLEWLDSEENWRPELRTAAIFSLHHTSVITWEMNSPGSKLLQNSLRKYGSVFQ